MPPVSFEEFAAAVLPLFAPPVRRKRTAEKLRQVLREFAPLCPDTAGITPAAVAAWIAAHPDRSPISSFALLRSLAAAVKAGKEMGLVPADPFAFRPPSRWWPEGEIAPVERERHLSAGQARRLLDQADGEALRASGRPGEWEALRLANLVRLYLFTGVRRSEGLALRVEDVDLGAGLIAIVPNARRHLKPGASRRRVPIPGPLAASLGPWLAACGSEWAFPGVTRRGPWLGGPAGEKALDRVKQLGDRAGVPGVTILALRHTFATIGEGLGYGELLLQRLLGHRRRRTQLHYRHEDAQSLRDAASRFAL